jgi:hypothetical protein
MVANGGAMKWHSLVEKQIKHPAGSAATTVIFGFIAGVQLNASGRILDYVFALMFATLAGIDAYCLAKAVHQLRTLREQVGSA